MLVSTKEYMHKVAKEHLGTLASEAEYKVLDNIAKDYVLDMKNHLNKEVKEFFIKQRQRSLFDEQEICK